MCLRGCFTPKLRYFCRNNNNNNNNNNNKLNFRGAIFFPHLKGVAMLRGSTPAHYKIPQPFLLVNVADLCFHLQVEKP